MKRSKVTQKDLLYLAISIFVVVAAWIGFNLYHTWVTTKISAEVQKQVIPIDPSFDMETIRALKTRQKVAPRTELTGSASASRVTPTPRLSASISAQQNIIPITQQP